MNALFPNPTPYMIMTAALAMTVIDTLMYYEIRHVPVMVVAVKKIDSSSPVKFNFSDFHIGIQLFFIYMFMVTAVSNWVTGGLVPLFISIQSAMGFMYNAIVDIFIPVSLGRKGVLPETLLAMNRFVFYVSYLCILFRLIK